jgi:hypothetical protein
VRRGASWTAAYHLQLTVAAVAGPVRSSMVPLVLRAAELSWGCCSPRRHLPGGASSRHPASASPWSTLPGCLPWRRSPVGVQHAVSNHPSGVVRGPAVRPSGVQPVRCSVTWGRRPGSGCPARLLSTRPASSPLVSTVRCPTVRCPTVCCPPVGPDASVSSHTGRGRWDQAGAAGATVTAGSGRGPGGGRAVEPLGRRPSRLGAATLPRSHVGQWGRWGLAGWVRAGAAACAR